MVLGNVPKLHGLIATLAAVAALPVGCSADDFTGCEASRTCAPANGGNAGSGAGGESGADTTTGGTSGSSSGTSGSAGADDGGTAGIGGSGDDNERPTVEAFTPTHASTEVERDIEVTAELSEPLDESTVTSSSVTLDGPDGEVAGTVSLDGNVISFVPDKPLYLLGNYTFTLADTIADVAGNTLAESASAEFQVRDGRWSEPTFPFGETPRLLGPFNHNGKGDIVIAGSTADSDTAAWAAVYNAAEDRWTGPDVVHSMTSTDLYVTSIAIDSSRRAALTWGGYGLGGAGWFRFTEGDGWANAGAQTATSVVAVTDQGHAVSVWGYGSDLLAQAQDIGAGTVRSATRIGPLDRTVYVIVPSLERVAMITITVASGDKTLHATWYDPVVGWGTPMPLAVAPSINDARAVSDELGNLAVLWAEGSEIWSRMYNRAREEWSQPMLIATLDGPEVDVWALDMTRGNAIAMFAVQSSPVIWGAYYQAGAGWVQNSIIEITGATSGYSWLPVGTIDARGNALVTWGDEFGFRRYRSGEGWQAVGPSGIEFISREGAVAPDGSIAVVGPRQVGTNEYAPALIRFE